MATVNSKGYIVVSRGGGHQSCHNSPKRIFWIGRGDILIDLNLPRRYWGRRIAFKVVELDAPEEK